MANDKSTSDLTHVSDKEVIFPILRRA